MAAAIFAVAVTARRAECTPWDEMRDTLKNAIGGVQRYSAAVNDRPGTLYLYRESDATRKAAMRTRQANAIGRKYFISAYSTELDYGQCASAVGAAYQLVPNEGRALFAGSTTEVSARIPAMYDTMYSHISSKVDDNWGFIATAEAQPVVTTVAQARMRVPDAIATRATHDHVIRVRGHFADGRVVLGRDTYLTIDPWFEQRERLGTLVLQVDYTFPSRTADGGFTMPVRVRNPFDEDVVVEELRVRDVACDQPGGPDDVASSRPGPRDRLIGGPGLAAGASVTFDWSAPAAPGRCSTRGFLVGRGATTELAIRADWDLPVIDRPPVARAEAERVRQAMAILSQRAGKPVTTITLEDLRDLEAEKLIPPPATPVEPPIVP